MISPAFKGWVPLTKRRYSVANQKRLWCHGVTPNLDS